MNELVSVIILTYKQFDYLYRLLDSVFRQTYPEIEIVLCDDGSPEFDAERIRSYIRNNSKDNIKGFEIIHNEQNLGTVKNLNNGIRASKGKYLKLIAGDDLYPHDDVFMKQIELLNQTSCLIVTGKVKDCTEDDSIIQSDSVEKSNRLQEYVYSLPKEQRLRYCLKKRIVPYVIQAFCFKRAFFDQYGLFDERFMLMEDSEMTDRIINADLELPVLPEVVVLHRNGIGVSANDIVISPRSISYYTDTRLWFRLLSEREKSWKWKLIYRNHYQMASFRIDSINADKSSRFKVFLKYFPSLLYYAARNPGMISVRIRGLRKSMAALKQ